MREIRGAHSHLGDDSAIIPVRKALPLVGDLLSCRSMAAIAHDTFLAKAPSEPHFIGAYTRVVFSC